MKYARLFLLVPALILTVAVCGDKGESEGNSCPVGEETCGNLCYETNATFEHIHQTILRPSCTFSQCHDSNRPAEDLDFSTAETAYEGLVSRASLQRPELMLVAPGAPDDSYLINKLIGVGMSEFDSKGQDEGGRMPLAGPQLCDPMIDTIRDWIVAGAPNN